MGSAPGTNGSGLTSQLVADVFRQSYLPESNRL